MLEQIANFIPQVLTVMGGSVGVFLATAAYKKVKGLAPQNNENKLVIRSVGVLFGAISTGLIAFSDGNLVPQNLLDVGLDVVVLAGHVIGAHLVHKKLKQ